MITNAMRTSLRGVIPALVVVVLFATALAGMATRAQGLLVGQVTTQLNSATLNRHF